MVAHLSSSGLIAATRANLTPPLDDLVAACGWPLVLEATPRRLARELSLHRPECVLFWMEDCESVAPTARLIEWSQKRGARPYRIAIAFALEADVEPVLRSSGAHGFLAITDLSTSAVSTALELLLADSLRMAADVAIAGAPLTAATERPAALKMTSDPVRPP